MGAERAPVVVRGADTVTNNSNAPANQPGARRRLGEAVFSFAHRESAANHDSAGPRDSAGAFAGGGEGKTTQKTSQAASIVRRCIN